MKLPGLTFSPIIAHIMKRDTPNLPKTGRFHFMSNKNASCTFKRSRYADIAPRAAEAGRTIRQKRQGVAMETTCQAGGENTQGTGCSEADVVGMSQAAAVIPRRTVIYVRTASAQEGDGGIVGQRAACTAYAQAHTYAITSVFEDAGASGASLDRPGLTALREAVRLGEIHVVLVASADRLARHLADQTVLIMEFDRFGVAVHIAHPDLADEPDVSRLLTTLEWTFTWIEHDRLVQCLAYGKAEARARRLAAAAAADPNLVYPIQSETCRKPAGLCDQQSGRLAGEQA
jgi:hypothetical protein